MPILSLLFAFASGVAFRDAFDSRRDADIAGRTIAILAAVVAAVAAVMVAR